MFTACFVIAILAILGLVWPDADEDSAIGYGFILSILCIITFSIK